MDLIIITNGPGELATWAKSTVELLKKDKRNLRIAIFLPPCPYSTGEEEKLARDISGVDVVLNPKEFLKFLVFGKTRDFIPSSRGLVVFLGGDLLHAILVSKRSGFPSIAYTVRASFLNRYFLYCLVPNENTRKKILKSGIKEDNIKVVGNLLLSAIKVNMSRDEAFLKWELSENTLTLGLMPGSRKALFRPLLPYFLKVTEQIRGELDIQYLLALSPHISIEILEDALKNIDRTGEVSSGELKKDETGFFIETKKRVKIRVIQNMQYDVIKSCDLVLCLPGTITAETAYLGIPMIVCYSLAKPEIIPLGGLPGLIEKFPLFGVFLKRFILKGFLTNYIRKSFKYLSHPNILANEMIVPEINILYYAEEISKPAIELLKNKSKRAEISEKFKTLFNKENAGEKVAGVILETMEKML